MRQSPAGEWSSREAAVSAWDRFVGLRPSSPVQSSIYRAGQGIVREHGCRVDSATVQGPETRQSQRAHRRTSAPPTYYGLLGISRDATPEQIERAYRQRIREIHPDQFLLTDPVRHALAQEQLKDVLVAIQVLRDPGARRRYDALLEGRPLGARMGRSAEGIC